MKRSDFNERPGLFHTWKEARAMLLAALFGALLWTLLYQCAPEGVDDGTNRSSEDPPPRA